MLKEVETWNVQDATKLQEYMSCPRKYFYTYVAGWKSEIPNLHFVFGTAWHMAQEVLLTEGYDSASCAKAYAVFEEYYRRYFDASWDDSNKPKNPLNVMRAIPQYTQRWKQDHLDFKVLHVEVAGSVAISADKALHFKTDTICQDSNGKYFSLEHKTGQNFSSSWSSQWRQKMQVGVYSHVLYCMYPEDDVYGVKINGAFFRQPPKLKANGEPYANARDNEFQRIPVRRNLASMNAWLEEVTMWYDRIIDDFQRLSEVSEDDAIMKAFPRNTESCSSYGSCPFLEHCSVWHNPMQHVSEPPIGWKVDHWDPRKIEGVKEVVNL